MLNALYDYRFHRPAERSRRQSSAGETKRTSNNRSKTRDKEHRHFFSWALSVRVVESPQFPDHLHPAAKFVLAVVLPRCGLRFMKCNMEKDFTSAVLHV